MRTREAEILDAYRLTRKRGSFLWDLKRRLQILWFQYEVTSCSYSMTSNEKLILHIILLLIVYMVGYGSYKQIITLPTLLQKLASWA